MIQLIALTQQEVYLFVKVQSFSFFLIAIYSRPYLEFKHALWNNLQSFCEIYDGPCLTFDDFNDIASENEKFGGNKASYKHMHEFNSLIHSFNLIDLGFTGQDSFGLIADKTISS